MEDVKCPHCQTLLFKAKGGADIEVKCRKCKRMVYFAGVHFGKTIFAAE